MTSDESALLAGFLDQLIAARAGVSDAEADTHIARPRNRRSDARELLTRRALRLEQALRASPAQLRRSIHRAAGASGDSPITPRA